MITLQCALCGNNKKTKELYKESLHIQKINAGTFSARRTPDNIHHRFVKCLACGLIFSNPILSREKIYRLYKKSSFDYALESSYLKKTYGRYLQLALGNIHKEKIKLLDIGCGNGFFLEEAKHLGIGSVYGIEPGMASVKKAPRWLQKYIKIGFFKESIYKKNSFDIVCCFQTLDHIIDPNSFLKDVYFTLKKGGKILFIVHDTDGLSVRLFQEKSPIFDIEHIFLFNRNTLSKLFVKNGFKNIKIFSVKNDYPLFYWVRMIPLPKKMKETLLAFIKISNLTDFPLSLHAGNIGIIAQK